jgi:hypothetical protein
MPQVKLIESQEYYDYRRRYHIFYFLFLVFPGAILINARHFPLSVVMIDAIVFGVVLFYLLKYVRQFNAMTAKRKLNVGEDRIWVNSPDAPSNLDIPLADVDQIILPARVEIPMEDVKGIADEIKGKGIKNYIIIKIDDRQHRFDYVVDSYYMIKKLEDMFQSWINKGIKVQRV